MQKNNAALLYMLTEIRCGICNLQHQQAGIDEECSDCDFYEVWLHYKKLAESEL